MADAIPALEALSGTCLCVEAQPLVPLAELLAYGSSERCRVDSGSLRLASREQESVELYCCAAVLLSVRRRLALSFQQIDLVTRLSNQRGGTYLGRGLKLLRRSWQSLSAVQMHASQR
jgi:hypothetical protein